MPTSIRNPYDRASRGLVRRAGLAMLCWLLKVSLTTLKFTRWLDTHLSMPGQPERVCDTVAHLLRADEEYLPYAAPIEFQAAPDPLMSGRMGVSTSGWSGCSRSPATTPATASTSWASSST